MQGRSWFTTSWIQPSGTVTPVGGLLDEVQAEVTQAGEVLLGSCAGSCLEVRACMA